MRTFVGTSGWSYKEWKGSFYPAKFPAKGMLGYYAERFRAVEVNNSFYRIPTERVLAGWAEQVPDQFRFVMKASRRITHNRRLRDDDGSLGYFLRAVNPLGARLGPTLFQLPPTFELDIPRLTGFLHRLPKRWPSALEFRHPSWFVDEIYELLRSRDIPLVTVDEDQEDGGGTPLTRTASWGYLRLRRRNYSTADLTSWADRVEAQGWTDAYIFLKHEQGSPAGPAAAQELNAMLRDRER
jgi:uncharacterized protein YecE (DUF72 family)